MQALGGGWGGGGCLGFRGYGLRCRGVGGFRVGDLASSPPAPPYLMHLEVHG